MSGIQKLWEQNYLPTKSGLYYQNGSAIEIVVRYYPQPTLKKGAEFDGDEFIKKYCEDEVTTVDSTKELVLLNNKGRIAIGEGSYGSEGFIAYVDDSGSLNWVFYFEESNPIIQAVEFVEGYLHVTSSAGVYMGIPIDDPYRIKLL
jgi:hypothetical protein